MDHYTIKNNAKQTTIEKLLQFKSFILESKCGMLFDFDALVSSAKDFRALISQGSGTIYHADTNLVVEEVFQFFKYVRIFVKDARSSIFDAEYEAIDRTPLNDEASIRKACCIFCQVVANLCAKGDEFVKEHVFVSMIKFGPDILAVGSSLRCRRCLAMAFAITYNCLVNKKETIPSSESDSPALISSSNRVDDRLQRLLGEESACILRPLLLALVDIPLDTNIDSNSEDPALEWSHIMMFKIIKDGALRKLFYAVGSTGHTTPRKLVTHEQLIALYLSVCVLEDTYCNTDLCSQYALSGGVDEETMTLIIELSRTVSSIEQAHGDIFNSLLHTEGENSVEEFDKSMLSSLQFDFLSLALQFIGAFCAFLPSDGWGRDARNRITNSTDIIDICCKKILHDRTPLTATTPASTTTTTIPQDQQPECRKSPSNGLPLPAEAAAVSLERKNAAIKSALQLLANLMHGCVDAQELLRESGGLAIVLSNCFTDFDNPFAREWALVCVRNACMDNPRNQDFIDQLKRETK